MDIVSKQASGSAKEAKSRKLLSVILTFVLATTLMVPQAAWADDGEGGAPGQPGDPTMVAKIGDKEYATLNEAIAEVPAGSPQSAPSEATTITLLQDTNAGFDIGDSSGNAPKNVVLDLAGKTLTLGPAVGSTGTETNGIRVLAYSKCEVKNGTVVCSNIENDQGGFVKMGMANYGTLGLVDVQMQAGDYVQYTINNRGALTLAGTTSVENGKAGACVAVTNDPYDYFYTDVDAVFNVEGDQVTVGKVLVERYGNKQNAGASIRLDIAGGTFGEIAEDGNDVVPVVGNITGGTFSNDVKAYVAEGYSCSLADGVYVVHETPAPVVATIGNQSFTSLGEAIVAAKSGETIALADSSVEEAELSFSEKTITLDLNGKTIELPSLTAKGADAGLTIVDSTVKAAPVVDDAYKVTYQSGKLCVSDGVFAREGAFVTLESGTIDSGNLGLYAAGDAAGKSVVPSTVTLAGGYVIAQEFAVSPQGKGATANVVGGVAEARDNAAVAGNGSNDESKKLGGTIINITDGTLIGRITSKSVGNGYASCGVYHPQEGILNITGGTIYSENGCGILMRGGTLDFSDAVIVAQGAASFMGKVGDSRVVVPTSGIVYDKYAGYYDSEQVSVAVSGDASVSGEKAAISVVKDEGDETADKRIVVNGGTFSSDVSQYCAEGLACSKVSDGVYQIQKKIVSGDVEIQAPVVSEDNVPTEQPAVPEKNEALDQIAGSLNDAIKTDAPVKDDSIGGNKIESGAGDTINDLVKNAGEAKVSTTVVISSVPVAEDDIKTEAAAIKDKVAEGSDVVFYDLGVKLVVEKTHPTDPDQNESVEAKVAETASPIPFQIKFDDLVGKDVQVVRYHDAAVEILDGVAVDYASGVVTFYGDKFSTYAVALADSQATVTFDSKGGTKVDAAPVAKGDLVAEPAAPTREGYEFAGWYADEALTTAWDFAADRVTGDVTLYAKWNQKATPDVPAVAKRLGGDDRYKTMELVSKEAFPTAGSCETVIIARGNDFPDALAASALAGIEDAQVLITETDVLTAETKAEIKRLGAKNAIVLGDEWSVSARTFNEIKSLMSGTTTRIGGEDRVETALKIYQAGKEGWGKTAIVATSAKAADSLSISPVAYALESPIFLANGDATVSRDVLDAIAKGGFTKVVVLGDKYSVSDDALASIKKAVADTVRIGGADRYETSKLTAEWAMEQCDFTCSNAMVTAGRDDKYADALVSSALGARNASPLLLVDEGSSVCIDKVLVPNKSDCEKAYVLGDKYTVSDELYKAVEKALA